MKMMCNMAKMPKEGVKVLLEGNFLQVSYDFEAIEQPAEESEDNEGSMRMVSKNAYIGEYVELRGGERGYDAIISAIVEDKYPTDKMDAVRLNYELAKDDTISISDEKRAEYLAEYKTMQEWRIHAKEIATIAVGIIEGMNK